MDVDSPLMALPGRFRDYAGYGTRKESGMVLGCGAVAGQPWRIKGRRERLRPAVGRTPPRCGGPHASAFLVEVSRSQIAAAYKNLKNSCLAAQGWQDALVSTWEGFSAVSGR